jgi:hypothetical protein
LRFRNEKHFHPHCHHIPPVVLLNNHCSNS